MSSPPRNFFEGTDVQVLNGCQNASALISATPALYGVPVPLAESLASLTAAYAEAYATANHAGTRTGPAITGRRTARAALVAVARQVAKLVQGTATVTDEQKEVLGVNVPKPRTPIGIPTEIPQLEIYSRVGTRVTARVHGPAGKTGRPHGVFAAQVYSFVGENPPETIDGWAFEGAATRLSKIDIDFDPTLAAGTKVWLTAAFVNPRNQAGIGCPPISTLLVGGDMVVKSLNTSSEGTAHLKAA